MNAMIGFESQVEKANAAITGTRYLSLEIQKSE